MNWRGEEMANIALLISLVAFIIFVIYFIRAVIGKLKRVEGTKVFFKRSFVAFAVAIIGFSVFGMNIEPAKETAGESQQEQYGEKKQGKKQEVKTTVTQPKEERKKVEVKKEEPAKKDEQHKSTAKEQITPNGGLGDTLDVFEKQYGENVGDQEMGRFQNDYILPIFLDGKAWNVKIQFEATNQKTRSMKEALTVAQEFIPKDAQKVKEYDQPEMGRKVIEYKSELLKQRFPDSNPPGIFIVIASYGEAGKENEVFGLTIGVGNNP